MKGTGGGAGGSEGAFRAPDVEDTGGGTGETGTFRAPGMVSAGGGAGGTGKAPAI